MLSTSQFGTIWPHSGAGKKKKGKSQNRHFSGNKTPGKNTRYTVNAHDVGDIWGFPVYSVFLKRSDWPVIIGLKRESR